jgi:flavin reductase (DIM6/NTAB) family NADH-FMN oxidoreductase RutF
MGVMACIGGNKLTKDRINETGVFSANLVTEEMLPLADYFGNKNGYSKDKMELHIDTVKGDVLNVPILSNSPVSFELEVSSTINLNGGEVFLCKVRNVLVDEKLCNKMESVENRIKDIAPISTTCGTYFSWSGNKLGVWGEPKDKLNMAK